MPTAGKSNATSPFLLATAWLADLGKDIPKGVSLIVRITAICLLFTLALAWPLFSPEPRVYAMVPAFSILGAVPKTVGWAIYVACLGSLLWLMVQPKAKPPLITVLSCVVFLVVQDITRLQPYVYMYWFIFFIVALSNKHEREGLAALRVMIAGVYFWAGFHKINVSFFMEIFPWFIEPIHQFTSPPAKESAWDGIFMLFGIITPFFEAAIGVILLLLPRYFRLATVMAFIMLVVVLVCLGPLGHKWGMIVWPWNIHLFMMEVILFWRAPRVSPLKVRPSIAQGFHPLTVLLFVFAPALAIVTHWYSMPGFKLYSGNIVTAEVMVSPKESLEKLPDSLRNMLKEKGYHMDIVAWTHAEFRHLAYPTSASIKMGAKGLCTYLERPDKAKLKIYEPPPFYSLERKSQEMKLCPEAKAKR